MTLWVAHAGKYSEGQSTALLENCVVAGWDEVPNLAGFPTLQSLKDALPLFYPGAKDKTLVNWAGQLMAFRDQINIGDLVALPLKGQPFFAVGEVTGGYQFHENGPAGAYHRRSVKWLDTALPRASLDKDLLFSMGSALTVSKPRAPLAEERVRAALTGKPVKTAHSAEAASALADETGDIAELARNQIADLIITRFKGHGMSELVADLLRADGFATTVSPPGADGGVDILAGRGALGLEAPRIVVQVKSGAGPADAPTVRELQSVVVRYGAEYGLFVSWGGFKVTVERETQRDYFKLRLWNSKDVIDAVLERYDRLSDETRAQLPLRRVWALAPEEE